MAGWDAEDRHTDRWADRQTDRQTDTPKIGVGVPIIVSIEAVLLIQGPVTLAQRSGHQKKLHVYKRSYIRAP